MESVNLVCAPHGQQRSAGCVPATSVLYRGGQFGLDVGRYQLGVTDVEGSAKSHHRGLCCPVRRGFVSSQTRIDSARALPRAANLVSKAERWGSWRRTRSAARMAIVRAKDSSQHDTADRSDAVSEEKESRGLEGGGEIGAPTELTEVRLEMSGGSVEVAVSNVETGNQGFVLGLGQPGAWDSGSIRAPVVRRYLSDNDERWLMWYSGRAADQQGLEEGLKDESIGLAVSSNGLHWERGNGLVDSNEHGSEGVGKVLDSSSNWWAFDTETMCPSDVLVMSSLKVRAAAGVYWMYYTGGSSEEVEIPNTDKIPLNLPDFKYCNGKVVVPRTRPGLVMSHDGRNWARIEGDHHSGSLFDVGGENEWDSLFVASPRVVYFNADDLRVYYHSFDAKSGCFSVGFARSRDGMRWVKLGKVLGGGEPGSFDELGVKCPQVIPHPEGKGYLMLYEGVAANGSSSFGLARSPDGLSRWERCHNKPVFLPAASKNAWDSKEVHSPCLVQMDGNEWCLYYQGVDSVGVPGIGMAISANAKLLEFKRCQGLHL